MSDQDLITVVVADDDELLRDGLAYIIDSQPDLRVVGQARDGVEAVRCARELRPAIVLMDIRMPRLDGLEATRQVKELADPPRVLLLTIFDLDEYVFEAFRGGADGFLLKRVRGDELHRAIRIVAAGDALIAPEVTRSLISYFVEVPPPVDLAEKFGLTEREIDVLAELAAGYTNQQIADRLRITENTVKSHLSSAFMKTNCTSRVQAVILAYDTGLALPRPLRQPRPEFS